MKTESFSWLLDFISLYSSSVFSNTACTNRHAVKPNYNSSIYLFALIYTSRVNVFKTESEEFELWCLRGYRKLVKDCLRMISLSPEERNTGFPILALHVYLCSLCCGNFQEVQLSFPLNRGTCDNTFKASFFWSVLSSCLVISPPFPHLLTHIKHSFPHSLPCALFRQHHLATEAGCCGNISQRSWLPSLLP